MLFIDVETVPEHDSLLKANTAQQNAWVKKAEREEADPEKFYLERAALFPEFGKIVCISAGFFSVPNDGGDAGVMKLRLNSFYGPSEKAILEEFNAALEKLPRHKIVAHNGKGFDFQFIAKRCVVNQVGITGRLQTWGKKPWELDGVIDTMELWKFGSWQGTASLEALCGALNVPTPKGDMDGSKVFEKFKEGHWRHICTYCEGDVVAMARCMQKMLYGTPIADEHVESATKYEVEDAKEG